MVGHTIVACDLEDWFAFEEGKKKPTFMETFLEGSWRDEEKGPRIDASISFMAHNLWKLQIDWLRPSWSKMRKIFLQNKKTRADLKF